MFIRFIFSLLMPLLFMLPKATRIACPLQWS